MVWAQFGDALRAQRAQTGLSQRALAARAGVSERTVRGIESGAVQRPQRDVARRLADSVGLDLSVLPDDGGGSLRVGVLGPLVVEAGTHLADVGPAKQQALLGLLALQPGAAVSVEGIVDALWGTEPPASAVNLVHTYSSRLRRALESYEGSVQLVSTRGGYRLLANADALDLWRFNDLVERAARAEDPQAAVDLYEVALDCWRGPVLADLPAGVRLHPAAAAVGRRRLAAVLVYADAALSLGRCDVERVRRLADVEPLHEGLHARLMLALAADGQQASALQVFDDLRRRLRDELGVDPGAEMRDAQLRVLRGDPAGEPLQPSGYPRPAELPADVTGYVGRDDELQRLDEVLSAAEGQALVITSIDGMPGVGKTALAVHWAHRVAECFPDGQLYVNLRGYDRTVPVQPQQALARFLRALGVAADRIPADEDEAASLYRSLLAERRVLVVLDNASSVDQVQPLLPGSSSCFVVVTSRDRLTELAAAHGTRRITLDVLPPDEAHTLVADMIGANDDAVDELARICGYLPLVLRVAAANVSAQPHGSAQRYVAEMRARGRLAGSDTVRAAFDVSFERLQPPARDVFPLLGLAPGDFTPDVVAALADCTPSDAADVLQRLCAASLLQEHAPGRYRLHDLLREYATTRADALPSDTRTAAARRMLDFYLCSVDAAARLLYVNVWRAAATDSNETASAPTRFASEDDALAWLDAERANLLEMVARTSELGVPDFAWRLIDALRGYLFIRGFNADGIAACQAAQSIAKSLGDRRAEASVLDVRGLLCFNTSEFEQARIAHVEALAISRDVGDREAEANALHNLGRVYSQTGTMTEAASCFEHAIAIRRELGDVLGEATTLGYLGVVAVSRADLDGAAAYIARISDLMGSTEDSFMVVRAHFMRARMMWARGQLEEAERGYVKCLEVARANGVIHGELAALVCMAENLCDLGRYEEAEELAVRAFAIAGQLGDRRQESGSLEVLAISRRHHGDAREAEALFLDALQCARDSEFSYGEVSVHVGLAGLRRDLGRPAEAVVDCKTALDLMYETGEVMLECEALVELALAFSAAGQPDDAVRYAMRATELARERGQLLAEGKALRALGILLSKQGDESSARTSWVRAAEILHQIGAPEFEEIRDPVEGAP